MKLDSTLLDKAIKYAVDAHSGTERQGKGFPYIVHPMEAMAIVATMTNDQELLAAATLHDVVEDTDVTAADIDLEFGSRIAKLAVTENDNFTVGVSTSDSWHSRKQAAMDRLRDASIDAKMMALGHELSNMRAIAADHAELGDELWKCFHTPDAAEHGYYRGIADSLSDLAGTRAYREFVSLIDEVLTATNTYFSIE